MIKRKTVWLTPKTLFNDSLGRLFHQPNLCCGYDLDRQPYWDEVNIIWKPITPGPDYAHLPHLEFLSTLFTTHQTLTEKLSLLLTGRQLYPESSFFEIQPYSQSSSMRRLQVPLAYLQRYPELGSDNWITKPTRSWGGAGIRIFSGAQECLQSLQHRRDPRIVQKYLEHPLLFQGRKFDIRMYVLLTPHRILFYHDGFARVCPKPYTAPTGAEVQHDGIHLTNLDQNGLEGTIHLLPDLGVAREPLYDFLRSLKPLFQHAQQVEQRYQRDHQIKFRTFELLGIDIILDQSGKPWLLEINKDPATSPDGNIDQLIMGLVGDTLKEAIFFELEPDLREATGFRPL